MTLIISNFTNLGFAIIRVIRSKNPGSKKF